MKVTRKTLSPLKRLRFRFEVAAVHGLAGLVRLFPRPVIVRVGRGLGWLAYYGAPRLRRLCHANLDTAFGDTKPRAEKARIARASLQNVGGTLLALGWSPRLTRAGLDTWVSVDVAPQTLVRDLQTGGKGIIFVTLHYGDWELLGLAMGLYGIPVTVVQEAMPNERLEQFLAQLRSQTGHRILGRLNAGSALLRTLKKGGNIALLIDLNATRRSGGEWLNFFGLPVYSLSAIGALAEHTGATVVPAIAFPRPGGRVQIEYGPSILTAGLDRHTINQHCLTWCEQVIRTAPEHWLWCYKRFTPRATPEQGRYPAYSRYWPDLAPRHEPTAH